MKFSEIVEQAKVLLQRKGRLSSRGLKREFGLEAEELEDLKFELLHTDRVAREEEEGILVWAGASPVPSSEFRVPGSPQPPTPQTPNSELPSPPSSYTPPHLAERIRAEQAALEARGATDGERKTITAIKPLFVWLYRSPRSKRRLQTIGYSGSSCAAVDTQRCSCRIL